MDINHIQGIIENIFQELTPPHHRLGSLEYQWSMDTKRHHYQILATGWERGLQVNDLVVKIDITDDLIWVQQDNTDYSVAERLVEQGIPKTQIVLGFQPADMRPDTGFATGQ
jgi:XisI protein